MGFVDPQFGTTVQLITRSTDVVWIHQIDSVSEIIYLSDQLIQSQNCLDLQWLHFELAVKFEHLLVNKLQI